jgi:outer membrane immunogenic protein
MIIRTISMLTFLMSGATAIRAADMPLKASPASVVAYNWSGIYIGGSAGGAWNQLNNAWPIRDHYFRAGSAQDTHASSFVGGGHVGIQHQWSSLVLGVEASFWWYGHNQRRSICRTCSSFLSNAGIENSADWSWSIAGRIGHAWDRWLAYAKGGYAETRIRSLEVIARLTLPGLDPFADPSTFTGVHETHGGAIVGAGIEYALTDNWIVGLEYSHIFISGKDHDGAVTPTAPGGIAPPLFGSTRIDGGVDVVQARLSYKINPWSGSVPGRPR